MIVAALPIVAPLAAALLIVALRRWPAGIALLGVVVAAVAAPVTLAQVAAGERFAATVPGLPGLPLRLVVDPLAALLATVVAVVAALVFVYAVGYMANESDQARFFAGMSFFVAAMQTLVLAGDWLLFLAAWELIGLASYLLIGFWYERPGVAPAATRAFATTRAADLGLYLGVFIVVTGTGSTAIGAPGLDGPMATVAGLAFLLAAIGKSAQAPLQGWLLDAMAGPTPVSALLHSATLVVAGVVLISRAFPLLPAPVLVVIGLTGGVTALVSGVTAIAQRDLKRMLAASTSSQLGLMLLALGAGFPAAAILHLVTNAAMKSALFLGAGIFQHTRESTTFARLAGVGRQRRLAFAAFVVAGLALAGVPPLAGFWSKDAVIAATLRASDEPWLVPLAVIGAMLAGVYVARAARLLWRGNDTVHASASDPDGAAMRWMHAGLLALAGLAVGLGFAVEPIGHVLGAKLPTASIALMLGLAATAVGLATGWLVSADRLLGPLAGAALNGFRVGGGVDGLIVRPVFALANAGDRLDRRLHGLALGVGGMASRVATAAWGIDGLIHEGGQGVGTISLAIARAARATDDLGIDGLIAALVARTRELGSRARLLQSGLVHRELLVAAGGVAVVLAVLLLF